MNYFDICEKWNNTINEGNAMNPYNNNDNASYKEAKSAFINRLNKIDLQLGELAEEGKEIAMVSNLKGLDSEIYSIRKSLKDVKSKVENYN